MELRHLKYFVAIADALSFRGAAERLHVAQPALSKQIRDLENTCGARLFERTTKRVQLTEAGTALLEEAKTLLLRAEALPQLAREASHGRRERLTIGNIAALTAAFLPRSLADFHGSYPDVEINLVEMRSRHQRLALRGGRIQVGLIGGGAFSADDDFERVCLVSSPFKVVMARSHPLAAKRRVSLEDLGAEKLLGVASEPGATGHAETLRSHFVRRGLKPPFVRTVDCLDSLIAMTAAGQGISILPGMVGFRPGNDVVSRPIRLEGAESGFTLWAVWRKDEASHSLAAFIAALQVRTRRWRRSTVRKAGG